MVTDSGTRPSQGSEAVGAKASRSLHGRHGLLGDPCCEGRVKEPRRTEVPGGVAEMLWGKSLKAMSCGRNGSRRQGRVEFSQSGMGSDQVGRVLGDELLQLLLSLSHGHL